MNTLSFKTIPLHTSKVYGFHIKLSPQTLLQRFFIKLRFAWLVNEKGAASKSYDSFSLHSRQRKEKMTPLLKTFAISCAFFGAKLASAEVRFFHSIYSLLIFSTIKTFLCLDRKCSHSKSCRIGRCRKWGPGWIEYAYTIFKYHSE